MMAQYLEIKQAHPECLLFYRMGDFYEMFFQDAVTAAAALDLTLTKRGRHDGDDIPMCGVPIHNHEIYLRRLVAQGFKVALCEQMEDPAEAKKRGAKSVVKRDVVRVYTQGTLTEDSLLDARAHNFLAALAGTGTTYGLAWLDLSTGEVMVQPVTEAGLSAALARLNAKELLVPEKVTKKPTLFHVFAEWRERLTVQPDSRFDSQNGRKRLEAVYEVGTLAGFGTFERAEVAAAGALISYVELTQKGKLPRLLPPRRIVPGSVLEIDAATRMNLELTQSPTGEKRGSLLGVLDRTVTGAGARQLTAWLSAPLTDASAINERLDAVGYWTEADPLRQELRTVLKAVPDLERALSRLGLGRGGPRDLAAVRDGLSQATTLRLLLAKPGLTPLPPLLRRAVQDLGEHSVLVDRLQRALAPDPPLLARDGNFIAKDYAPALDELLTLRDEGRRLIAGLQTKYSEATGITSLKVKHNNVLGYHIEVTATHADRLMKGTHAATFIHRQTTANTVRFTSVELTELEQKIAKARDQALAMELELFQDLVGEVIGRVEEIGLAARALAALDVTAALAELAVERQWCRPQVEDGPAFRICGGRHPVVEQALMAAEGGRFVPNDCDLAPERRLWLLTGPNMAGKSTFLRQNALMVVLAQMGSYVPADSALIGTVDRLFSRVGAADDLARGRSTFMVEMLETAAILNQAGKRSLVILDEIGRGTATFDGLSIAWACVEHLHNVNRCRSLFATHYHELTRLAETLPSLACRTMRVKEWQQDVVFLHEVVAGTADRSYGIHVARLAGLPKPVVKRAEAVLKILEQSDHGSGIARLVEDLPLFSAAAVATAAPSGPSPGATTADASADDSAPASSAVEDALQAINPDDLSPRAALEALYRLKDLLGRSSGS